VKSTTEARIAGFFIKKDFLWNGLLVGSFYLLSSAQFLNQAGVMFVVLVLKENITPGQSKEKSSICALTAIAK